MLFSLYFQYFRTVPSTERSLYILRINPYHHCRLWPLSKVGSGCLIPLTHILEQDQQPKVVSVVAGEWLGEYLREEMVRTCPVSPLFLMPTLLLLGFEDISLGDPPGPVVCPLAPSFPRKLWLFSHIRLDSTQVASLHPALLLHSAHRTK